MKRTFNRDFMLANRFSSLVMLMLPALTSANAAELVIWHSQPAKPGWSCPRKLVHIL